MTERDFRNFKKLLYLLPIITLIASLLIQWGGYQANSANYKSRFEDHRIQVEKRLDKVENEKADADVVESKFSNVEWKLDLILNDMGIKSDRPLKVKK